MTAGRTRIFVSAGEPSGERHAAALVRELRARGLEADWDGMGTEALAGEGVRLLVDLRRFAVMGFFRVVPLLPAALSALAAFARYLREDRPDLVVLVDSPGLHGHLAAMAARRGIPVVAYICPQMWAWAPWRAAAMRRRTTLALGIFEFEREWFGRRGIEVETVGHPLFDHLAASRPDAKVVARLRDAGEGPLVAILPGSRRHEVEANLPVLALAAKRLFVREPSARFACSARDDSFGSIVAGGLDRAGIPAEIVVGRFHELILASRLALVTSGSATLEVAWFGVPMVVSYRTSPLGKRVYGIFGTSPFIASINLLARGSIVPERLLDRDDDEEIARCAQALLHEGPERREVVENLARIRAVAARPGATAAAADRILALLRSRR